MWQWVTFGTVLVVLVAAGIGVYLRTLDSPKGETFTRAADDLLEVLSPDRAERLGIVPKQADRPVVMRGWDFGVRVTGHGSQQRFERGGEEYRPSEGHRFRVLRVTGVDGESADARVERVVLEKAGEEAVTRDTSLRVRIGERERRLPGAGTLAEGETRVLLVSVPEKTGSADLLLTEKGLDQTVSLVTGRAGTANPAILSREDLTTELDSVDGELTYRIRGRGAYTDESADYRLTSARLAYRRGYGGDRHASRDSAYLVVWGSVDRLKKTRSLVEEWLSLRLPDGSTRQARNYSDQKGYVWVAFEVPADFRHGTLVFTGTETLKTRGKDDITLTVVTERTERLSIGD